MYRWIGWFGPDDCEPPELGKYWIEIQDMPDLNEFCIIVHRTENFDQTNPVIIDKERRAQFIVDALNATEEARTWLQP